MTLGLVKDIGNPSPRPIVRDYISWSAISAYRSCPLRYFFRYAAALPEETISANLIFGSAIHAAIEHHYRELLAGLPPPELAELFGVYQENWAVRDLDAVKFGKDESVQSLAVLAEKMLAAFQASDIARPAGQIIGVEEELRGQIGVSTPDLLARVDLLLSHNDGLVVIDFKTARCRWSTEQAQDSAEQLFLYHELVRVLDPRPVRLQFAVINKTKSPAVEVLPVVADPRRIERTKQVVERVWHAIEAGHFYPSPSALECPGCPYRQACQQWCV